MTAKNRSGKADKTKAAERKSPARKSSSTEKDAGLEARYSDLRAQQLNTDHERRYLTALGEIAVRRGSKFLEIGSWLGDSAITLGKILKPYGGTLVCIDTWHGNQGTLLEEIAGKEDILKLFRQRIRDEGLENTVFPLVGPSARVAGILEKSCFDLVFVDADHRYEHVLGDIQRSMPLVSRAGGILCGHDCDGTLAHFDPQVLDEGIGKDVHEGVHCGVVLAVGECFVDYLVKHQIWNVRWDPISGDWARLDVSAPKFSKGSRQRAIVEHLNYRVVKWDQYFFAYPDHFEYLDFDDEGTRKRSDILFGRSFEEIERKIFAAKAFARTSDGAAPVVEVFEGYDIVELGGRWHVADPLVGSERHTQAVGASSNRIFDAVGVADSLQGARDLIASFVQRQQMRDLNEIVQQREIEIEAFREQLAGYVTEIGNLRAILSHRDAALGEANTKVADRDQALGKANATITKRDLDLGEANMKIVQRDAALVEANAKIVERDRALSLAQDRIDEIERVPGHAQNFGPDQPRASVKAKGQGVENGGNLAGQGEEVQDRETTSDPAGTGDGASSSTPTPGSER